MKIYVGNLPWSVDESKLKELFAPYDTEEITLIKDKFSGRSKGFGFVTFKNEADGKKAISEINGKEIEGREIKLSEAKPMEDQPPRRNFDNRPRRNFDNQSGRNFDNRPKRNFDRR